jgi:hypothetical protein
MRENVKCVRYAKYERAKMRDARKCEMRGNVKTPKCENHENREGRHTSTGPV